MMFLVAFAAMSTSPEAARAEAPKLVPGQWVAYVAPKASQTMPRVVFVPERAPEAGERIPRLDRKGPAVELSCLGEWQLQQWKPIVAKGARGGWGPSPSGDGTWVWHPKNAAATSVAVIPTDMPDASPDYGDEFVFCATTAGEPAWAKPADGKRIPGSWVTLVDGKRTTTLFVANTEAGEGDVLPELPTQERRIRCASKLHPRTSMSKSSGSTRPAAPYGRWVADPFGSKRWAWVPRTEIPFALRPTASPPNPPARTAKGACSWFEAPE